VERLPPGSHMMVEAVQLQPEHAEQAARADAVVFLDAAVSGAPGEVRANQVTSRAPRAALLHALTPEEILGLARTTYGNAPQGLLVTVGGKDFSFVEPSILQSFKTTAHSSAYEGKLKIRTYDEAGNLLEELAGVKVCSAECKLVETGFTLPAVRVEVCYKYGSAMGMDDITYCTPPAPAECPCGEPCTTDDGAPGVCEDSDGDDVCECTETGADCPGATCETYVPCMEGSSCGMDGVCGSTPEGGGACVNGLTSCDGLLDCVWSTDCPTGVCVVESCCVRPVCVPAESICRPLPLTDVTSGLGAILPQKAPVPSAGSKGPYIGKM